MARRGRRSRPGGDVEGWGSMPKVLTSNVLATFRSLFYLLKIVTIFLPNFTCQNFGIPKFCRATIRLLPRPSGRFHLLVVTQRIAAAAGREAMAGELHLQVLLLHDHGRHLIEAWFGSLA
ncbi:hypothetical protein SETIT_2G174900v2 [Setaria italica]|uniref:Uncharacterized protein n=1 Tax=Setaria italica TaxID=4555 RepID=A0A368Q251_SETIT|nr:hypothetical protein SETIT_2G174900v2 [Setaria italica]